MGVYLESFHAQTFATSGLTHYIFHVAMTKTDLFIEVFQEISNSGLWLSWLRSDIDKPRVLSSL